MAKSQTAVEFIFLSTFMLFIVVGFFAGASSVVLEAKDGEKAKTAEDIANFVFNEIETAKSVNDGYFRTFSLPARVKGLNYSINIIDNRELVVVYLDYEYVKFLPSNISGNVSVGFNAISKSNGVVYLGRPQCSDSTDNDGDTAVDYPADAGCQSPADNRESN